MLKAIQGWRSVCLHPQPAPVFDEHQIDKVIGESARMSATFQEVDRIEKMGDKALIFLEALAWQDWLSKAIRARYNLRQSIPIINGSTSAVARQSIVDRFQAAGSGFDVLLLSPKAAGVGLTITAATHVFHLSRWWNPAVEDQATDRAYRIGQERDVTVHLPLAEHPGFGNASFDLKLDQLMERKRKMSRDFLAPPEISDDEFGELFD